MLLCCANSCYNDTCGLYSIHAQIQAAHADNLEFMANFFEMSKFTQYKQRLDCLLQGDHPLVPAISTHTHLSLTLPFVCVCVCVYVYGRRNWF